MTLDIRRVGSTESVTHVRKTKNGRVIYGGPERRKTVSYVEALYLYPQLRSISILYYRRKYTAEELNELYELQNIVKHQDDCWEIELRRLHRLCGKWGIAGLPNNAVDIRAARTERARENQKLLRTDNLISNIYDCAYKFIRPRKQVK